MVLPVEDLRGTFTKHGRRLRLWRTEFCTTPEKRKKYKKERKKERKKKKLTTEGA